MNFEEMTRPLTEEEWPHMYLKVTQDKRFKLFGLSIQNILDVKFYLDCWMKTPQDLRKDVPKP